MYRPGSGLSKATASTLCQKCLKRGHYSYECKAVAQERPYVSRPSRTQQLANPKLVPKLTADVPQELLRKTGVADEELAKKEAARERERKREREDDSPEQDVGTSKRRRSLSSSISVSTISTQSSRSRSPQRSATKALTAARSPSPISKSKRRRDSISPARSYESSDHGRAPRRHSRNSRRRISEASPPARGRPIGRREDSYPSNGRSPSRERSGDRRRRNRDVNSRSPRRNGARRLDSQSGALGEPADDKRGRTSRHDIPQASDRSNGRPTPRERSLSPFSKRSALTKEMQGQ